MPRKPPLGVMPKHIWLERRIDDLTGALVRYIKRYGIENEMVIMWGKEVRERFEELEKEI